MNEKINEVKTIVDKTPGVFALSSEKLNELVEQAHKLFERLEYNENFENVTTYGFKKIFDEWSKNKGWLVKLFEKSEYYDGDFKIVIPCDIKRDININDIETFHRWVRKQAIEYIKKYEYQIGLFKFGEYNKNIDSIASRFAVLVKYKANKDERLILSEDLDRMSNRYNLAKKEINSSKEYIRTCYYDDCNSFLDLDTYVKREEFVKVDTVCSIIFSIIRAIKDRNIYIIDEELEKNINKIIASGTNSRGLNCKVNAVKGQKISRYVNALMKYIGFNKITDIKEETFWDNNNLPHTRQKDYGYNYQYAKFSDAINPKTIKYNVVMSVDPVDYWTSSFGYNWASCHTIDVLNVRDTSDNEHHYQGMYSSGTESYMLDESTFVVYIRPSEDSIKRIGEEYLPIEEQSKLKRCLFSLGEDKLLQSRLYPDGRDGGDDDINDLAAQLRDIVQTEISKLYDIPNFWLNKKGCSECSKVVDTHGTHYEDYSNYDDCNVSYMHRINGFLNEKPIIIGHEPICPSCGRWHSYRNNVLCESCANPILCCDCGCAINSDEDRIYCADNDEYYCRACVSDNDIVYCQDDDSYHFERNTCYDNYTDNYYYYDSDKIETYDGNTYCCTENAINDGYDYSDYDDEWVLAEELYHIGYGDTTFSIGINSGYVYVEGEDIYFPDNDMAIEAGYVYSEEDNQWIKKEENDD